MTRLSFFLLASLTLSATASAAEELSTEARDEARVDMDEGHANFKARDYKAALAAYRRADKIMNVPTTKLGVARALVELGRLLEARRVLADLLKGSVTDGEPAAFVRARDKARAVLADLASRTPTLSIRLPKDAPDNVSVLLDDSRVSEASIGTPSPLDPGTHAVVVTAPGFSPFAAELTILERANEVVEVLLERRASERAAQKNAGDSSDLGPREDSTPKGPDPLVVEQPKAHSSAGRAWSYGSLSLGIGGLVAGGLASGLTFARVSDLEANCPNHRCPESARALHTDMQTLATIADVTLPLGAALFGAGALGLGLTAPDTHVTSVRFGPGTLTVRGVF